MSCSRLLALGLIVIAPSLLAQSNAGQITGTVFDQTKSVIGGVTISAANLATNVAEPPPPIRMASIRFRLSSPADTA